MREEVFSSVGTVDAPPTPTPAASSAGASSPAGPTNIGSIDLFNHGQSSKAASLSCVGSQQPWTYLSASARGSALGSSRSSCRPWERGDLLRRLATFKPSYWFGKPKIASSLACAQRGWMNVEVDKIACESCGACLSFVLLPSWTPIEVDSACEVFAKQLDAGHKVSCPWQGNSCPESLVQFPPTPQAALIGGYKDRCDGLLQFQSLPVISASSVEIMRVSRAPQLDRFLCQLSNFTATEVDYKSESLLVPETAHDGAFSLYSRAQKLISVCGWEPRWLPNVQDCEEHSAQSARNGCSFGPTGARNHPSQYPRTSKNVFSGSVKKETGKNKVFAAKTRCESRSPLLDCSLCGATVRIWDFLTVPRPASFAGNNIDMPDVSKKITLTRGVSAASGISGWIAVDDIERELTEGRDEVATTDEQKLVPNPDVDLNLTMAGGFSFTQLGRSAVSANIHESDMGRDLIIGQPSRSEVGDRAASFESRGPSSRKRSLGIGGSSEDRPQLGMQQADSIEGIVIDRDGDEVTDGRQYSAGPSKRARDSDIFDTYCSSYQRDSSGAGPSHSLGFGIYADANGAASFQQGSGQGIEIPSARDSTRVSSVIAMDTFCHVANEDSMESVENYPGDMDDVQFPSSSTLGNVDVNDTSELNFSNQAQRSIGFQVAAEVVRGEIGGSSTNDGEEIFNAETVTAQARDGLSLGMSGGSVGMCASHEAEIRGTDNFIHRADSAVGDAEARAEDAENQGQTGESAVEPGLMDEIVPEEMIREDPNGDNQEMLSRSVGRADSGSKIDDSTKAESSETGVKMCQGHMFAQENGFQPSLSCNANSGHELSKNLIAEAKIVSLADNCADTDSECAAANGIGPPRGESNYEEAIEFDPIIHHNQFCPWVNGNVAAAGSSSCSSSSSADAVALCGWQLTLDALDALRSLEHFPIQPVQSESAASLYKDDQLAPSQKLLKHQSISKSHGQL